LVAVNQPPVSSWAQKPQLRVGAVVAVALAIAFVVWLLVRGGGGGSSSTTTTAASLPEVGPTAVSVTQLGTYSDKAGHAIYWAGPIPGTHYELTQTKNGSIYVRYLPQGVPVGTKALHTLVGSYPVSNAYKVLQGLAKEDGEISFPAPGSAIAVYSTSSPTNVYLAYPNSNVQIEVFDPSPARARSLITSGQIAPVP
jgi:hypothetical protein